MTEHKNLSVVAINSSPRANGNTTILLNTVLDELRNEGISTELIQISTDDLKGCKACGACAKNQNSKCIISDDRLNEILDKMIHADGILLGSPVYFSDINSNMKALIDRAGYVARANGGLFSRKVGAGVVAVRRAGAMHALATLNHLFMISEMVVPSSTYWNLSIGRSEGEVTADEEGMNTMHNLGKNFAWLLKKL